MYLNRSKLKKMKITSKIYCLILSVLIVAGVASCKKSINGGTGAPTVTRVRLLSKTDTIKGVKHRINLDSNNVYSDTRVNPFDSTVTSGRLNTQYGIVGTNLLTTISVSFNGVSVYFNPALVTDNIIIVTIPSGIPFGPSQINKLTIVTQYGTVDYNFGIQQPPPVITSFTPLAGNAGDIMTITGTVFNSVSAVRFDNVAAQIIGTPTTTQIQVKVPVGVVQAYVYVTTPGGTAKSPASFGFKALIYDDAVASGWGNYYGYNSIRDLQNTLHPKRGTYAIQTIFQNAYGALQIGYGGATINVAQAGLTAIKFSIYGDPATIAAGNKVQIVINGNYGSAVQVVLTPGAYTDYTIPLSSLGNPATITEFVMQAYGLAAPSTIYVDDIGFI
jgi:hypothetical protein